MQALHMVIEESCLLISILGSLGEQLETLLVDKEDPPK